MESPNGLQKQVLQEATRKAEEGVDEQGFCMWGMSYWISMFLLKVINNINNNKQTQGGTLKETKGDVKHRKLRPAEHFLCAV